MHKLLFRYCIYTALLLFSTSGLFAKTIYVVDSYHGSFAWTAANRLGFEENLADGYQVHYFEMDTKRIPPSQFAKRADKIWSKLIAGKPDLIVTMDDNALKHLGQRITDAGYPLLFMGINNDPAIYFRNNIIPAKVAGIFERPLLKQNVALISKVLTMKNRRVLLVMDNGTTSSNFYQQTLNEKTSHTINGIKLDVYMAETLDSWKEKFSKLSPQHYDAVLIGSFSTLKNPGQTQISDKEIYRWTSLNSIVPIFTFWSNRVGKGKALGGMVISGYEQGANAAIAANDMLENGNIPLFTVPDKGNIMFSRGELKRWNLSLPDFIEKRSSLVE